MPSKRLLMTRRIACLLLLLSAACSAQKILYTTLGEPTIESRLRAYKQKNADREAELRQLFTEAGCGPERLTDRAVKGENLPNLVCTLPGETDEMILVSAHFDHVELGTGVIDNWSGASMLPSLFESLKGQPRRHTFVFVGFTDEEGGLRGSRYYADHLTSAERAKIDAVINLDSLALGPTKVWGTHSDKVLLEDLADIADRLRLPIAIVNADQVGDEDGHSFMSKKIPTLMLHSVTQQTIGILHTPQDNWNAVRMDDYYGSYRLIAGYLAYIDTVLGKEKGAGEKPAPAKTN